MSGAGQVSKHHPEAVIERNGNADAIVLAVPQRFADEEAVVQNVVVREGSAFGKPGRPARVLDVDRIVELQQRLSLRKLGR